jgi:hypothetical protein
MSDFRAIAGVSASLRNLLLDRMEQPVPVTIAPPDVEIADTTGRRINLYLYQVTENNYLRHQELPTQGHPGTYGYPPLALNLHYLLTAYGETETAGDADLQAQQILGDAMRVLHDFAILTPELTNVLDPGLVGAFEKIKLTLQPASLDEVTKLWTAMPQANFRRSALYEVSVVQIESQRLRSFPQAVGELPEQGPRVYVLPFRSPQIQEVRVQRPEDPPDRERRIAYARIGDTLILRGRNLAETTKIMLSGLELPVTPTAADRLTVQIPDQMFPDGSMIPPEQRLQPGPQTVRAVQEVLMGEPPLPHRGFQSNLAVWLLVPQITTLVPSLGTVPATLTVNGSRLFRTDAESLTLVGDQIIRAEDYTTATDTSIAFNLPALSSGLYGVRVRVNGAESVDLQTLTIPP